MATPLSCAGPRRTLPLDSGRAAATCPGRVGTCLPPLLPTPGTCSSLAGWQPSRALPPAGPAAAATRAHLLPSSCLTNNWHLLFFNRFQCVAPKLVILFWSSMVKDAVLCSNPVPDGSAARALAGREPDRPRFPLCQPRCTPTAAARPSNPSPATASRPSRTMPAASLRQWPAHLAVVAPSLRRSHLLPYREAAGGEESGKDRSLFTQWGPLVNEASGVGGVARDSGRAPRGLPF
jgi:hypothetical protein